MADCTVAGKIHRYRKPVYSMGSTLTGAHQANNTPRTGNRMKVLHITHRCSRQWLPPAIMASRESFAPCIKNSSAIAAVVKPSKNGTKSPLAGKKEASKTTVISVSVNGSRIRKSFIKTPESRCRYFAFFHLRNKIDLLHLYMNLTDELFSASTSYLRHRCSG